MNIPKVSFDNNIKIQVDINIIFKVIIITSYNILRVEHLIPGGGGGGTVSLRDQTFFDSQLKREPDQKQTVFSQWSIIKQFFWPFI